MKHAAAFAWLALLLGGCGSDSGGNAHAPSLEAAAIARGLIADPASTDIVGLYARDTDRLCVVPEGSSYRVGASIDYGEGVACSAGGSVARAGNALRFVLGGAECAFDARFDGARITFPARLPAACAALCTGRASLAAFNADRLSNALSEAAAMRDARGRLPCRG